jgi:serine/threonine-protein kinase PknG
VQTVDALIATGRNPLSAEELANAASVAEGLSLDMFCRSAIQSRVLRTTLDLVCSKQVKGKKTVSVFGCRLQERDLRLALERTLRSMAQLVTGDQRIRLVDEANSMRPRSLI